MRNRDASGELYRVLLMLGICFFHAVSESPYNKPWLANLFQCCVNGFVFISGWYGINFRPSKLLRLYGVGIYCGIVFTAIAVWQGYWSFGDPNLFNLVWSWMTDQWFLSAYVMLMLLSPTFNFLVDKASKKEMVMAYLPLLILFAWSWSRGLPIISKYAPSTNGLGSFSALSLSAVYVFARILKRFDVERYLNCKVLLIGLLMTLFCTGIGFGEYSSPFATLQCAIAFFIIRRMKIPNWIGTASGILGPSMFSVYLIHAGGGASYVMLRNFEHYLATDCLFPSVAIFFVTACLIFSGCVLLDIPRRVGVRCLEKMMKGICSFVDNLYDKAIFLVINKIEVKNG